MCHVKLKIIWEYTVPTTSSFIENKKKKVKLQYIIMHLLLRAMIQALHIHMF